MMCPDHRERRYDSYAAFYADAYAQSVVESHQVGRMGASLVRSSQDAGDWSDAATPDLVVTMLENAQTEGSLT